MDTFTGNRIYLRKMTEADATPLYASWLSDPEVNAYLATKSAVPDELKKYIKEKNTKADTLLYGIFLKDGDRHIGTIKLEPIDLVAKEATIGIMVGDKTEWGKGYAPEAMQLLITYSFNEMGLEQIRLGVIGQNTSAIRAYEKLGFEEIKREPQSVVFPNGTFDQVTMMLKKYA